MDEVIKNLENFTDIWNRVNGSAPTQPNEASILRELIRRKYAAVSLYSAAAKKIGAVSQLWREEASQLHMLRGEYFLLTGEKCAVSTQNSVMGGTLQILRSLYIGELSAQEYINENASVFTDRDTRRRLLAMAQEDEKHAGKLKSLTVARL